VLAGTPPKCCGECGSPWERVVERERGGVADIRPKDQSIYQGGGRASSTIGQSNWHDGRTRTGTTHTLGWRSTCDHDDDSGSATVLDPFAGSGTTGVVALRHNRSFVGLELNPEYVEMARRRICDDAPLFNTGLEAA
jgi:hypothetical protein